MSRMRNEKGAALPAVLGVLLVVGLLGAGAVTFATAGSDSATEKQASQTAQESAENGLEAAKFQLASSKNPAKYDGKGAGDFVWAEAKGGKKLRFSGDSADRYTIVTIKPAAEAGKFDVRSTGHNDGTARKLAAVVDTNAPPGGGDGTPGGIPPGPGAVPPGTPGSPGDPDAPPGGNPGDPGTPGTPGAPGDPDAPPGTPGVPGDPDAPPGGNPSDPDNPGVANRPPEANDDLMPPSEMNTPVVIPVLDNDNDPDPFDNPYLKVNRETNPVHGTVTCTSLRGSCTYTPKPGYFGPDEFTYKITDPGGLTSTAVVKLNVKQVIPPPPPNPRPPVAKDDQATTPRGIPVVVNVLRNDTIDPALPATNKRWVSNTKPPNGTAVCSGTGNCTYTPKPGYFGKDTFGYVMTDGQGGFDKARVIITIPPPVADNPPNPPPADKANNDPNARNDGPEGVYTMKEDSAERRLNVLVNDDDPDGDPIRIVSRTKARHGAVKCFAAYCTYKPAANFDGIDSFDYTISDPEGGKDTATVRLRISSQPEPRPPRPPNPPKPPKVDPNDPCGSGSGAGTGTVINVVGNGNAIAYRVGTPGADRIRINANALKNGITYVRGGAGDDYIEIAGTMGGNAILHVDGEGGNDTIITSATSDKNAIIYADGNGCGGSARDNDTLTSSASANANVIMYQDGGGGIDTCRRVGASPRNSIAYTKNCER